jgi:hypothetical protein
MADIENAYLTAPITKKVWTVFSPEFGDDSGKRALIVRALYDLKSASAVFRNHIAECMTHLGWTYCCADRDPLVKPETGPGDGVQYWAYNMIYVDDILCVHHENGVPITKMDQYFKMKNGSIKEPDFYLGARLKIITLPNGVIVWGMSSRKCAQSAVQNMKDLFDGECRRSDIEEEGICALPLGLPPRVGYEPVSDPCHDQLLSDAEWGTAMVCGTLSHQHCDRSFPVVLTLVSSEGTLSVLKK